MAAETLGVLCVALFTVAMLYASVGHGGASGYIAVMALLAVDIGLIRPTALVLNVVVATVTSVQFYRAGCFSWRLFWPFAFSSVPLAFAGSSVPLPATHLKMMVGIVLLLSALRLFLQPREAAITRAPPNLLAFGIGAAIGLVSGLTGTGGGIFLTPVLLLSGWASARQASGVSALFIFVNSAAGLAGYVRNSPVILQELPVIAGSVFLGGTIGSYLGSHRLPVKWLHRLMSLVLAIAGAKLLLT